MQGCEGAWVGARLPFALASCSIIGLQRAIAIKEGKVVQNLKRRGDIDDVGRRVETINGN